MAVSLGFVVSFLGEIAFPNEFMGSPDIEAFGFDGIGPVMVLLNAC